MTEYILSPSGNKYYTNEYVESLREANLALPAGSTMFNFIPQEGFQERCLLSEADIMIIGGKRGGGKSRVMNMMPLYNIGVVGFNANRFRKEEEDCRDGIYKDGVDLYRGFGNITDLTIKFNNGDSYIDFGYLQNEKEIDRRLRGRQMPDIGIDELSQLLESTFFTSVSYTHLTLPTIYSV